MENCLFCKIIRKEIPSEIIFENEKYFAFLDIIPINPGHTLIMPKKHTDYIFDLPDDEYQELFSEAKKLAKKIKSKLNPKRIGMVVEGFGVPHVHVHFIPINHGHEIDSSNAKPAKPEELKKIAEKILH